MKKGLLIALFWVGPAVVHGICPKPAPKACSAYFENAAVFVGTILAMREVRGRDDPGAMVGWRYRIRVERSFRGLKESTIKVDTPNDSSRRMLDVGQQYLLFASSRNHHLEIGDDCGPLSDPSRIAETVREIESLSGATMAIVEGEVRKQGASGAGVSGVTITVSGMGRIYRLTSDAEGQFRGLVPPGRYRITPDSPSTELSDLSRINPSKVELVPGQCAQAQYIVP